MGILVRSAVFLGITIKHVQISLDARLTLAIVIVIALVWLAQRLLID